MTFLAVLISLLIERFFDWSHLRHWNWYYSYQEAMIKRFQEKSPALILALILIPIMIITYLIELILSGFLYGFLGFVFQLVLLIYCLGPKNLWADTFASIHSLDQGDRKIAEEKLKPTMQMQSNHSTQPFHRHLLSTIFVEANRRVFALIFWFIVLGPVGAILYRSVTLSANPSELPQEAKSATNLFLQNARTLEAILDWIPIRILTFILALVSHFTRVFNCWRAKAKLGFESNDVLLTECGAAALGVDEEISISESALAKNAITVIDRTFVVTLVIVALLSFFL